MNIPVFRPSVNTNRAIELLRGAFERGWIGQGPLVEQFEKQVADMLGTRHFIATNSGTAALHLAVRVLGLPAGSEVVTSPITFVSGNAVLLYEKLCPLFAEVEPLSGNLKSPMDWKMLKRARAIIVTHLGGFPCAMTEINRRAGEFGIPVIEDCAHAFGSRYRPNPHIYGAYPPVGSGENMCCFSFHAVKNLAMGDGGGITTHDDELAARLRRLRWMGIDKSTYVRTSEGWNASGITIPAPSNKILDEIGIRGFSYMSDYDVTELGFKYHMNDVSAAIGLAGLETVEGHNMARLDVVKRYHCGLKGCEFPWYGPNNLSSCHFWPVFVKNPAYVAEELAKRGIATSRHYKPNSEYKIFREALYWSAEAIQSARFYYDRALVLPIFPSMTEEEIGYVIEQFNEVIK